MGPLLRCTGVIVFCVGFTRVEFSLAHGDFWWTDAAVYDFEALLYKMSGGVK